MIAGSNEDVSLRTLKLQCADNQLKLLCNINLNRFGSRAKLTVGVDRRYFNDDNGRFRVNANWNPENRKLLTKSNLNPNWGSFLANSSRLSGQFMLSEIMYSELFHKTYEMLKWIYPTINKFPRKQRIILSQRIEVTAIRILELVIDFSRKDTKTNKQKIVNELHKLQVLLRLSKDLSFLSFKQYEHVSGLINETMKIFNPIEQDKNSLCKYFSYQ